MSLLGDREARELDLQPVVEEQPMAMDAPMDQPLAMAMRERSSNSSASYAVSVVENGFLLTMTYMHPVTGHEQKVYVFNNLIDLLEMLTAELSEAMDEIPYKSRE